ncbi:MAG TPA: hypothetical protein VJ255_12810, partial [Candidatus Acidoferrum sp.]|nr:hypothetical protein [Candidatus Acidoferrum sp.]
GRNLPSGHKAGTTRIFGLCRCMTTGIQSEPASQSKFLQNAAHTGDAHLGEGDFLRAASGG